MIVKLPTMPRPKLPEHKVKDTVGIKLPKNVISELETIGRTLDLKPSAVGRELLMLGLAVYKASSGNEILANLLFRKSEISRVELKENPDRKLILGKDLPEGYREFDPIAIEPTKARAEKTKRRK